MKRMLLALLMTIATQMVPSAYAEDARLLRFPTIHGDQIVFGSAGNLYTVSAKGGVARRITSHEGYEMFPRFSPDGKQIAFTGQYDGNTEVYVIPAEGGEPKRLTYTATLGRDDVSDRMGPNNIVFGWTPDGKNVLFRSRMRSFNDFIGQLYLAPVAGGLPEQLPLPRGGFASYSPDGKQLVYNRVFREFRTWKRYRGGMADDLWLYDFATKKTTQLTQTPEQDIEPMWAKDGRIYFLSDRGTAARMNLYSLDPQTQAVKQHTDYKDFDIKFPSIGDTAIVFEYGGDLIRFDLKTEKAEKVHVQINEDAAEARSVFKEVGKNISSFDVSHDGKRALFTARGDIFTVPSGKGLTKNLTKTPGVHERDAAWSPDGKTIAFISDASGECEIHTMPADGSADAKKLTSGADTYKYELIWSPDSRKIAWTDRLQRIQVVDVETKNVTLVAKAEAFEIRDFAWSPDSKWIAYTQPETGTLSKIHLYSLEKKTRHILTDGSYSASNPCFSGDGKYLFFVSARDFRPTYGQTEFNHIYQDMSRIYAFVLDKDTPNPFRTKLDDDEKTQASSAKKDDDKSKEKDADKDKNPDKEQSKDKEKDKEKDKKPGNVGSKVTVNIDFDGLEDRIVNLLVPASNYRSLRSVGSSLYFIRQGSKDSQPDFFKFDMATGKDTNIGHVQSYEISGNKKKMIVYLSGKYVIIDLPNGPFQYGDGLDRDNMELTLDHHAEWQQIYNECWRQMRDFFYAPNMHGVDWLAIRKKYEPLVPHVRHRADLSYIIGEMIGELNCGHAYVGGGEMVTAPRRQTGLLGAELATDPQTKFVKITKLLKGEPGNPAIRSPLAELGLNVHTGDYILAVNGQPTNSVANIFELLINTVGKPVVLKVNSKPDMAGARDIVVTPIADESSLYYYAWVQANRKAVSDATDGKVGYIHVPDMLQPGLNEFMKSYYPQLNKKALIIDVRGNGGGNVSPMLIERLRREAAMIDISRNGSPGVNPSGTFHGPLVCLMNEFSASDGDIFPYRFRHYKLGPLIGKRSWGGVVGIRGTLPLLDGGVLNRPEFSRYDLEGKQWVMEGHGVDPDIVVDNDPAEEFAGRDQQLKKAIDIALERIKKDGKSISPPPAYPKR
ncbi:MAG: S41 family peptidase [Gemmataceae bacterium]